MRDDQYNVKYIKRYNKYKIKNS